MSKIVLILFFFIVWPTYAKMNLKAKIVQALTPYEEILEELINRKKLNSKILSKYYKKSLSNLSSQLSNNRLPASIIRKAKRLNIAKKKKIVLSLLKEKNSVQKDLKILEIFLNTKGVDLFCLKQGIDNIGKNQKLYQLIYKNIKNESIRNLILAHFLIEWTKEQATYPTIYAPLITVKATFDLKNDSQPFPGVQQAISTILKLSKPPKTTNCLPNTIFVSEDSKKTNPTLTKKISTFNKSNPSSIIFSPFSLQQTELLARNYLIENKAKTIIKLMKIYPEKKFILLGRSEGDDNQLFQIIKNNTRNGQILWSYFFNYQKINHIDDPHSNLSKGGLLIGNALEKKIESYHQIIFDLFRLGPLKNKKQIKGILKKIAKKIDSILGPRKEFLINSLKRSCIVLKEEDQDLCQGIFSI